MNSYDLSRVFWDWAFKNPEKIKPNHAAIYFFAIEHCNRLGWKDKFGYPTTMAMEAIGIKSYNTYIKHFNELVEWNFFTLIERSMNQHSSNIISFRGVSKNDKANNEALDKAFIKHTSKQGESTSESKRSINKPVTNNQSTNKPLKEKTKKTVFNFRKSLIDLGVEEQVAEDWMKVRKTKKATNTETSFNRIKSQIEKSGKDPNECITLAVAKDWKGFEAGWMDNELKKQNDGISKNEQRLNALKEDW